MTGESAAREGNKPNRPRAKTAKGAISVGYQVKNLSAHVGSGGNIVVTGRLTYGDNQAPLDDCDISDNLFAGLGLPVGALGPFGLVRCCDNRVRQCAAGFFLLALVIPTASGGRTAADRRMVEATRLPMSPAMLVSVAESVKHAIAQPAGSKKAAAGADDTAAAPAAPPAPAADASIERPE